MQKSKKRRSNNKPSQKPPDTNPQQVESTKKLIADPNPTTKPSDKIPQQIANTTTKQITNNKKKITQKQKSTSNQQERFIFGTFGKWFDNFEVLPKIDSTAKVEPPKIIAEKKKRAEELFNKLVQRHDSSAKSHTDDWMRTVVHSGTTSDKTAALTLTVQRAPIYTLKTFDILLGLVDKKGRRDSLLSIQSTKDLFLNNLLPVRHLIAFHQRPLADPAVTDNHLMAWYFEDLLKVRYARFVKRLEDGLQDTVLHFKDKILKFIFELLSSKPEQEQLLLSLIINKLGDKDKKIASKANYLLTLLLEMHPNMKLVVVREVQTFLHRPNLSARAQYYSVIFLNQIILTDKNIGLSEKLVNIYFTMFKRIIGFSIKDSKSHFEKKSVDNRMLSALLTGVNRAFPFTDSQSNLYLSQIDTLFKIIHIASFGKASQALHLVWQVMYAQGNVTARFYRALYAKLMASDLFTGSNQFLFLNLLYKSLRHDTVLDRVAAFIKRIFQICYYQKSNVTCALLLVVSEVFTNQPKLRVLIKHPEEISEEQKKKSKSVIQFFQGELPEPLTDETLKNTPEKSEQEFEKQSVKAAKISEKPPKVKEPKKSEKTSKKIPDQFHKPAHNSDSGSDSSEEELKLTTNLDLDGLGESDSDETNANSSEDEKSSVTNQQIPEDVKKSTSINEDQSKKNDFVQTTHDEIIPLTKADLNTISLSPYEPLKREPMYCNGQLSCYWELVALSNHVHPSVDKWAKQLLKGGKINYRGDPIRDLDLISFLDRFSYKKPKQAIAEGNASDSKTGSRMQSSYITHTQKAEPVNSQSFVEMPIHRIRPDELFFYKYFKQQTLDSKKKKQPEDIESVDSDEADAVLEKEIAKEIGEDSSIDENADFWNNPEEPQTFDYDAMKDEDFEDDSFAEEGEGEDDFGEDEEDSDEIDEGISDRGTSKGKGPMSDFASLEEFAHLLEESANPEESDKSQSAKKRKRKSNPKVKPNRFVKKSRPKKKLKK